MRARVGSCLVATGSYIVAEIWLLHAGFKSSCRRPPPIFGYKHPFSCSLRSHRPRQHPRPPYLRYPIAMPTVVSVTLGFAAKQLAKHNAIVTRITAVEELVCA
ncbi:hypothetical protein C8F04DRAFT_654442 [Mycena alexandri]|uniref:Uncharacterized protein n=1 Tax=Mycena alexandri TaxID=1745969 RepID=A0AAD6X1R4_9AGAR|nr:hypothetical protein C8F04DRAFT_654442 [Mycena alexandri]